MKILRETLELTAGEEQGLRKDSVGATRGQVHGCLPSSPQHSLQEEPGPRSDVREQPQGICDLLRPGLWQVVDPGFETASACLDPSEVRKESL